MLADIFVDTFVCRALGDMSQRLFTKNLFLYYL